ncbi:metal-dependent phosphohydrolase [Methanosarcinales archaeon ex4572_44]|nr:MAG: metal-dependent phosphohydrolase [Methanosarcinales archaeon ex4572_44]
MKVIHDPVHGTIRISRFEEALIQTPQFQRLRGIEQLAMSHFVYPGANHTRFEHSLGTMQMAGRIADQLGLSRDERALVRVGGLLHDIGHPAFSHAVEAILRRNPLYQPVLQKKTFSSHEDFTQYIIEEILSRDEEVLRRAPDSSKDYFTIFSHIAVGDAFGAPSYLAQIISGDIDADRIDFLMRDSYHTGVSLGLIDVNQILESLVLEGGRVLLGGEDGYSEEMALVAAESILTARAHHYSAIIHNPTTQAARAMLLYALEGSLDKIISKMKKEDKTNKNSVSKIIMDFFLKSTDADIFSFIRTHGGRTEQKLITRLKEGRICPLIMRFNFSRLHPQTRTALAIITQNGHAKKKFEETLARRIQDTCNTPALVDLDLASGLPKTIRVKTNDEEGFFYDNSALANGLIRAISRQISLCIFTQKKKNTPPVEEMLEEIKTLSRQLLGFIREETPIKLEAILLIFQSLNKLFSQEIDSYIFIPKIHNITCIYKISRELATTPQLKHLFDYNYSQEYGFPYSDELYKNIQTLVAMEMLNEDIRTFERKSTWKQRYEYTLTPSGATYAEEITDHYKKETELVTEYLKQHKHAIKHDLIKIPKERYQI